MTTKNKSSENKICLSAVESHLQKSQAAVEKLERTAGRLPKVDQDGNSECPFAEQWYAEKEAAQKELNDCLQKMDEYRQWVDKEIHGCRNDLSVTTAHEERLHKDSPREHYSDAEAKISGNLRHLAKVKEQIEALFKQMQKSIQKACRKYYPGKIPGKYPHFSTTESQFPSERDGELNEIIQKGSIE